MNSKTLLISYLILLLNLPVNQMKMHTVKSDPQTENKPTSKPQKQRIRITENNGYVEVIEIIPNHIPHAESGFKEFWSSGIEDFNLPYENLLQKWFMGDLDSTSLGYLRGEGEDGTALYYFLILMDLQSSDIPSRIENLTNLAVNGSSMAQFALGLFYSTGLFVDADLAKGLIYMKESMNQGNMLAGLNMAQRHLHGLSLPRSCESAIGLLSPITKQIVANMSRWETLLGEFPLLGTDPNGHLTWDSSQNGYINYLSMFFPKHSSSQMQVGKFYLRDSAYNIHSLQQAFDVFSLAYAYGSEEATAYLGLFYLEGTPFLEKDYVKALELFTEAGNISDAHTGLGMMYLYGLGVDRNYSLAMEYFSLGAKGYLNKEKTLRDGTAYLHAGIIKLFGLGSDTQDYQGAREYFTSGSSFRNIPSMFYLAEMHANGLGIYESCTISSEFYSIVAENGMWRYLAMKAYRLWKNGHSERAYNYYTLLTEIGMRPALSSAVYILYHDLVRTYGVVPDRLLQLLKRSVKHSDKEAYRMLGSVYYYGMGVPVDMESAFKCFLAIAPNDNEAMFSVGYMYEYGLGVPKDLVSAEKYYEAAGQLFETWLSTRLAILKMRIMSVYGGRLANVVMAVMLVGSSALLFLHSWIM